MHSRRSLAAAFILFLSFSGGCKEFNQLFLADDTPIEACDPTASTYHGYDHFFDRDFLTRDGTLDYRKWFETNRVDASDCDPLRVREREEAAAAHQGPPPTSPPPEPPPSAPTAAPESAPPNAPPTP